MSQEPGRPDRPPREAIPTTGEFFVADEDAFARSAADEAKSSEFFVPDDEPEDAPSPAPRLAPAVAPPPAAAMRPAAAPTRAPAPAPAPVKPSTGSSVPLLLTAVVLTALAAGSYFAGDYLQKQKAEAAPTVAGATDGAGTDAPAPTGGDEPPPAPAPAAVVGAAGDPIALLSRRIDDLESRPMPAPAASAAPDLAPIRDRVDALSKRLDAFEALANKAEGLGERVDSLGADLAAVRRDLAAVKATERPAGAEATAARPTAAPDAAADSAVGAGADLFKQGSYAQALAAFRRLQGSSPDDARVWYFSALSNGLANRQWTGETQQWARRGVDLEREGKPEAGKIDAAFAGLSVNAGKDWLAAYRKQAK